MNIKNESIKKLIVKIEKYAEKANRPIPLKDNESSYLLNNFPHLVSTKDTGRFPHSISKENILTALSELKETYTTKKEIANKREFEKYLSDTKKIGNAIKKLEALKNNQEKINEWANNFFKLAMEIEEENFTIEDAIKIAIQKIDFSIQQLEKAQCANLSFQLEMIKKWNKPLYKIESTQKAFSILEDGFRHNNSNYDKLLKNNDKQTARNNAI